MSRVEINANGRQVVVDHEAEARAEMNALHQRAACGYPS